MNNKKEIETYLYRRTQREIKNYVNCSLLMVESLITGVYRFLYCCQHVWVSYDGYGIVD